MSRIKMRKRGNPQRGGIYKTPAPFNGARPAGIRVIKALHRGWSADRILVPEKLFLPCFSRGWFPRISLHYALRERAGKLSCGFEIIHWRKKSNRTSRAKVRRNDE